MRGPGWDSSEKGKIMESALKRGAGLAIWTEPVSPEPLCGGLFNVNFVVDDGGRRYVVRIGDDIVELYVSATRCAASPGHSTTGRSHS